MSPIFGSRGKTPVIGIDLGSGNIKMAQFKEEGSGLKLVNFGVLPVPEGAIIEGKIERPKEVQEIIKELLQFHAFIGNRVVANLSGQLVFVKELIMEDLPEGEIDEAIKWEIEKFLPFPIERATFDYQVLARIEDEKSPKLDILVASAPLDIVLNTAELFKMANLEPIAIEVEPFAVLRLLNFTPEFRLSSDILFLIVNIGHNYTSINMLHKGLIHFSRILPIGGKKITEAISHSLGKSYEEAEEIKIKKLDLDMSDNEVTQAALPIFQSLVLEIKRSINYYFNKFNEGKVMETGILLEGGSSNTKNIEKYVENEVGFPTTVNRLFGSIATFDPNLFTKEYLTEMAPMFSVATGLALREHQIKFNKKKKISKEAPKSPLTYNKG